MRSRAPAPDHEITSRSDNDAHIDLGFSISTSHTQLPDYSVERRGASLRPTNVVVARGGVPEQLERPPIGTVMKEATQRKPDLNRVDPALARTDHRSTQDAHR
jgi:hypothetical protein